MNKVTGIIISGYYAPIADVKSELLQKCIAYANKDNAIVSLVLDGGTTVIFIR